MPTNQILYCAADCGNALVHYDRNGRSEILQGYRPIRGKRYCIACADEMENTKELEAPPINPEEDLQKAQPLRTMIENVYGGGRKPMRNWRNLPVAKYDQTTFLTELGKEGVVDSEWAVKIVLGYELATADINRWLDTLRDPEAPQVLKDRARHLLATSADEFRMLCERRAQVAAAIDGPAPNDLRVTWKKGV